jgi:hypothetical protein
LNITWPIISEGDMAPEESLEMDVAATNLWVICARNEVRGDLAWGK